MCGCCYAQYGTVVSCNKTPKGRFVYKLATFSFTLRSWQLISTLRRSTYSSSVDRATAVVSPSVYVVNRRADRTGGCGLGESAPLTNGARWRPSTYVTAAKRNRNTERDRSSANREAALGSGGFRFRWGRRKVASWIIRMVENYELRTQS